MPLEALKHGLQQRTARTVEGFYARTGRRAHSTAVIVAAPVPNRNRGDQAMLDVAIAECRNAGFRRVLVVGTGQESPIHLRPSDDLQVLNLHEFFWHGQAFRAELSLMSLLSTASQTVIIGADILDEACGETISRNFLRCAELSGRMGIPTRIVGFSVRQVPGESQAARFRNVARHARLYARDPVSWARLREAGVPGVELSADTAFLLPPAESGSLDPSTRAFMERHQDCLAGVGLHDDFFRHTLDAERALEYLAAALRTLSERQGIRFILIPHGTGDVEGLRALHDLCGAGTRDVTHFVGYVPLAQEVKRILGFCGHVITSRMHVAIGALGMGVPVTSFVYRGKFEGLYQHFGLTDGLLEPTEAARGVEPLLHTFTRRLARSADEAAWIAGRLPDIVKLARRNYENLCLTP